MLWNRWISGLVLSVSACALGFALLAARASLFAQEAFQADMSRVKVVAPLDPPRISQESIDIALVMYGITVPSHVEKPRLDLAIADRGLTTLQGSKKLQVTIGPSAFASWSLLGSTLAHEIEVHCRQNFTLIRLFDLAGWEGTENAEREAYAHELDQADRFGLTADDRFSIAQTLQYYYPERKIPDSLSARLGRSVGRWLARPVGINRQEAR